MKCGCPAHQRHGGDGPPSLPELDLGQPSFISDLPYLVNGIGYDEELQVPGPPEAANERVRLLPLTMCPFGNHPVTATYGPFRWTTEGPPSLEPDAPEFHASQTGLVAHH